VADLVLVAAAPGAAVGEDGLRGIGVALLVGTVGQALVGSLTFLLPVVLGGGPAAVRAAGARLNRWWPARLVLANAAAALAAADASRRAGMLLAAAVAVEFLARAAGLVVPRLHWPARFAAPGGRAAALGAGAGAVLTAVAVLVATSGPGDSPQQHEHAAAGPARTVEVELVDMRVRPATVDVPAGTRLILDVVNRDSQRHDLRTATGERTPLLRRGERAMLDLGVVTGEVKAWCTVPGHRAAGMTFTVTTSSGHGSHVDGADGLVPYDAALKPAERGSLHRIELPVVEKRVNGRTVWTFGGTVPGPTLRGKVGDVFEVTLVNTGSMGHSIDFHASALAPDGPMRTIEPGERLVYRFRAQRAGIWMYHCSTAPMTQHIAAGMFGAVIIDPPDLAPVDREYVLVASEVYAGEPGSDARAEALRTGSPDGWAFNGIAGQYDEHPLAARVGQRVRFWVLNAGPGGTVSFHVVGAQFDTVYAEGAYRLRGGPGGAQALGLTAAQGGFVETVFTEPGTYTLVDHDMRHAEGGAHGRIAVAG
jgi:nitrite reductase (NO-forming)